MNKNQKKKREKDQVEKKFKMQKSIQTKVSNPNNP